MYAHVNVCNGLLVQKYQAKIKKMIDAQIQYISKQVFQGMLLYTIATYVFILYILCTYVVVYVCMSTVLFLWFKCIHIIMYHMPYI